MRDPVEKGNRVLLGWVWQRRAGPSEEGLLSTGLASGTEDRWNHAWVDGWEGAGKE
jgi:hypothetical protein